MTTNPMPHLFWITSRAAGVLALVLSSVAVSLGLLMSTKLLRRRGPELLAAHEVLSLSAMVAIAVHGAALLGDGYLRASLPDIAVPFVFSYETFWTSVGIIAGWATALLGLSYYARRVIGTARWRALHRLTALVWLVGLGHALGEGTDAGQPWFLAMTGIVVVPAVVMLAVRLTGSGRSAAPRTPVSRGDLRTVPTGIVPTGRP